MSEQAIGVDVGGTKIAAARVTREGRILARQVAATPSDDGDATMATIIEAARGLLTDDVGAVGVGAAGLVEASTGTLRYAPNIAWRDIPVATRLREALGLPCLVDNDANAAVWGEFRFGAGRGFQDMLLVIAGTGIGGGIVLGGRVFRGAHGFAGEIGHIIVEPGGPRCGCGNLGCWEQMGSGQAIDRLGAEAALDRPESLVAELVGGDPSKATGRVVMEAARRGDAAATEIFAEVGRRLGEGIAGLVNVFDPQIVVVGGGTMAAGDLLLEPARKALRSSVEAVDHRPDIPLVAAELGNDAGAIGAAVLAIEELAG